MTSKIFVFGSNLAGRHGKGGALAAFKFHGAVYGQGTGRQGLSYAIPTKDFDLSILPIPIIRVHVDAFLAYARANPKLIFQLTAIGCGLAGYKHYEIAPLFRDSPENVIKPSVFMNV